MMKIEYVYVGSDAPLWMCKYAKLQNHHCCYCVCQACHQDSKRPSRSNVTKKIKREDECDHENLEVFTDSQYFTKEYLDGCYQSNMKAVSKCSKCHKFLTDLRSLVAKV